MSIFDETKTRIFPSYKYVSIVSTNHLYLSDKSLNINICCCISEFACPMEPTTTLIGFDRMSRANPYKAINIH